MSDEKQIEVPSEKLRPSVEKLLQFMQHELKLVPLDAVLVMREAERFIEHRTGLKVGDVRFHEAALAPVIPITRGKDPGVTQ